MSYSEKNSLYENALVNSNFDIWQRNTSFTNPSSGDYTADHWVVGSDDGTGTAPSVDIARGGTFPSNYKSKYSASLSVTAVGTASSTTLWGLANYVEDFEKLKGKTVTISFWAKDNSGSITDFVVSGFHGGTGTKFWEEHNDLSAAWTKYTLTGTIPTDATQFRVNFFLAYGDGDFSGVTNTVPGGTGTVSIAQFKVEEGSVATPYQPRSFGDELIACQRYYQKSYAYSTAPATVTFTGTSGVNCMSSDSDSNVGVLSNCNFTTPMRASPTITAYAVDGTSGSINLYNNSAASNTINTIYNPTERMVARMIALNSNISRNSLYLFHWTAEAELT